MAHLLFHVGIACLVIGLSCLGILSLVVPATAAILFGLPSTGDAHAWVQVAGVRDVGLAAAALSLYAFDARCLRVFVPALLLIPVGDAALTITNGGTVEGALTHLFGTICIGVLAACAWLDPGLDMPVTKHS